MSICNDWILRHKKKKTTEFCSLVKGFGNFKEKKWRTIVEQDFCKSRLILSVSVHLHGNKRNVIYFITEHTNCNSKVSVLDNNPSPVVSSNFFIYFSMEISHLRSSYFIVFLYVLYSERIFYCKCKFRSCLTTKTWSFTLATTPAMDKWTKISTPIT